MRIYYIFIKYRQSVSSTSNLSENNYYNCLMSKRVDYKKIKTPQKIVKNQSVNHARRLSMQNRLSVSHRHKKAVSTPIAETLGAVNTKTPWALKKSPALVTAMLTGSHKPGLQGSYNQRSSICASPFRVSPKKHKLSELIPEV